jgi:hypothetical protein
MGWIPCFVRFFWDTELGDFSRVPVTHDTQLKSYLLAHQSVRDDAKKKGLAARFF